MATLRKWSIAMLVLSQAVVSTTYAELPGITSAELIKAVRLSDSLHKNVDCEYIVDEQFNKALHEQHRRPVKRRLEIHWRREEKKEYIDVTQQDSRSGKPFRFVMTHNGQGRKQWQPNDKKGDIFEKPYIHAWPVPIDFGMTLFNRDKKLGESLADCKITSIKREKWQGHECYFVQAIQPDGAKAEVWIDPEIGWRARRGRYWGPDSVLWYAASAEFKDCGNEAWFPAEGIFRLYGNDKSSGERVVSVERKLKVEQVKVNAKLTSKDFDIQFPPGTYVYDHSRKVGGVVGIQYPQLTGKPLPSLRALGLKIDADRTKAQRILICFWDMNQRPSRNCIMQLAQQAGWLKEKDVFVVTVQASKADENKLNEWTEKNNVPFPVGMVRGDEEKARFTWGVHSLPWLILTDNRHVVTDEGLSLAELDEKLSSIHNR